MHRHRIGNGIRGPTGPDKANDRAGNAVVRETDRGGSGINQPSRVSRCECLAPAASVGGGGADVKIGDGIGARSATQRHSLRRRMATHTDRPVGQSGGRETGVAGNRVALFVRPMPAPSAAFLRYTESGTASDER